jgi:hypothetical protein
LEETGNGDTSEQKVMSANSPRGKMGQKYLASGVSVAMRIWENAEPGDDKERQSEIMKRSDT